MSIKNKIMTLVSDENGGEIVEYAVVIGILVVGILVIMQGISGNVTTLFTGIQTATANGTGG